MKTIPFYPRGRGLPPLWAVFLTGLALLLVFPVASTLTKIALLLSAAGTWAALTKSAWRRKWWRVALLAVPPMAVIPFCLPGRPIDTDALRADYVRRMSALEGTWYVWGGENRVGIDCSGLPRRALRDSLFSDGLRHPNGRSFRAWLEQWWFDASAKALGEGYRGYTIPLDTCGTIRTMDYTHLRPGDLAVTTSGRHVLAYLGNGLWIQADPGIGHVAALDGRTADNGWFDTPVTTHRWAILSFEDLSR
ncbi:MAG: C40 family peptidase [Verrucomicrobia bacterium]|nr:C40 family peptidase [Verrucomicrobiota bacterium]